jgi:FeS assembly SUF system regulator
MFKISKMADYAVIVMVTLDDLKCDGKHVVNCDLISEKTGLQKSTVNQIVKSLAKFDLVNSKRGVGGGVSLNKDIGDITLGEVIRSVDGDVEITDCGRKKSECCSIVSICPVTEKWKYVNNKIIDLLNSITLKEMVKQNGIYS